MNTFSDGHVFISMVVISAALAQIGAAQILHLGADKGQVNISLFTCENGISDMGRWYWTYYELKTKDAAGNYTVIQTLLENALEPVSIEDSDGRNGNGNYYRFAGKANTILDPNSQRIEANLQSNLPLGSDLYTGFCLRVPADSPLPSTDDWAVISQWWQGAAGGKPRLALGIQEDNVWNTGELLCIITRVLDRVSGDKDFEYWPTERGVWYDLVVACRFDPNGDGVLRAWCEPSNLGLTETAMKVDMAGIVLGYSSAYGDKIKNHKFGIYRSPAERKT